jgi:glycosyltransferase involved in cell wall biosynthesis
MVGLLSDEIIVLEEDLRKRLKHIVNDAKIVFVPIAIEQQKTITKRKARRLLDLKEEDFIVLVFGFVNWYKGSDWIVNAVRSSHQRHVRLLMAGGENPTLKDKDYYKKFFGKISEAARNSQKILLTGFVPDNKIAAYFSAADVVVLPYRVFMSASGPFSFALSFRKPILLSNKLYDYTKSEDFSDSMELSQLERKEMFFPFNKYVFNDLIRHMRAHDEYEAKLKEFSRTLGEKRSTEQMVKRLEQILVPNEMIAGEIALKYS